MGKPEFRKIAGRRKTRTDAILFPKEKAGKRVKNYASFSQLPLMLSADEVAAVLGVSRANAYSVMRSEGFPTLHTGRRMTVPRDRLIAWIDERFMRGQAS